MTNDTITNALWFGPQRKERPSKWHFPENPKIKCLKVREDMTRTHYCDDDFAEMLNKTHDRMIGDQCKTKCKEKGCEHNG